MTSAAKERKREYDHQYYQRPHVKARRAEACRKWRVARISYLRAYQLRTLYGLTVEEADALIARGCGICGCALDKGGRGAKAANIDHDHATGKVRGALCFRCNVALGRVDAVEGWLDKARAYLDVAAKEK